jgi:hypothetical protein
VFGTDQENPSPELLRRITYGYEVDFEGTGELLRVQASPHDGQRGLNVDAAGFIASESYDRKRFLLPMSSNAPGIIPASSR